MMIEKTREKIGKIRILKNIKKDLCHVLGKTRDVKVGALYCFAAGPGIRHLSHDDDDNDEDDDDVNDD